jgi:hypothetical protein
MDRVNWTEHHPFQDSPDRFDEEAGEFQVFGIAIGVGRIRPGRRCSGRQSEDESQTRYGDFHWKSSLKNAAASTFSAVLQTRQTL